MMKIAGVQIAVMAALAASAGAAPQEITSYSECVALVDRNAAAAEASARFWQTHGGGAAAMHCNALALSALHRYADAARVLDALARNRDIDAGDRAELFDQAGNAWMLAGQGGNAEQSFSAALADAPGSITYLADRAHARAMLKNWRGADADLVAALLQDQNRADLLVLRASARWALGRKADAATDIVRALELYPDYPPALVERGRMKYSAGDKAGARKDWSAAAASGQGEAAAAAKRYLADLNAEAKPARGR
jgi:hypothetical protein